MCRVCIIEGSIGLFLKMLIQNVIWLYFQELSVDMEGQCCEKKGDNIDIKVAPVHKKMHLCFSPVDKDGDV